jgi:hypothetical protein
VPGESRLHIVDIFGQDAFNNHDSDRILSDPLTFLKCPCEVGITLKRC